MEDKKRVDESWKESAQQEKEKMEGAGAADQQTSEAQSKHECGPECSHDHAQHGEIKIDFLNYVTSLGFQAMIFLGELPNPMTNEKEKNLEQAKFLIDTLVMMKEKTQGNLNEQEENLLNASVYELQMKFVEKSKEENQT